MRTLTAEFESLVDAVHRDEIARAEQQMRVGTLVEKAMAELGLEPEALVADYGPDRLVPVLTREDGSALTEDDEQPEPMPYVREQQQKRLRIAERSLAVLGRVNPLALEEFDAMEERHKFLSNSSTIFAGPARTCWTSSSEVDNRVEQVFAEAFADVEQAFERVFARLFPGGEGRLVLTEPGDWLTTGVDVEARPPGKKIKRLSLLSGGERSLVAVAFLVSLFIARPSPFYILDEVEAALDDTNLGPAAGDLRGAAGEQPTAGDHPSEADDGDRRRALRRDDARRRGLGRDLSETPGDRVGRLTDERDRIESCRTRRTEPGAGVRLTTGRRTVPPVGPPHPQSCKTVPSPMTV